MHINITPQKIGPKHETYNSSVTDYVNYLEKENEGKHPELQEHFFDQNNDHISPETVISEIDGNTKKLKKRDPKFYSIVISPSAKELKHINNDPALLRSYTRELMKDYAASFYRDRKVTVDDIKYYAKIEHERTFRGFEKRVQENAPYRKQIAKLQNDMAKVRRGELEGNLKKIQRKIDRLVAEAPHKINGKLVTEGTKKEGFQTHVHIIVSRKDVTNTYSLSPNAQHKKNVTILNGKEQKQGFDRNRFFDAAEQRFGKLFGYQRSFIDQYGAKKLYQKDPKKFFALVVGLPANERELALKSLYKLGIPTNQKGMALQLFRKAGLNVPNIPTNKVQLAMKAFNQLKKGMKRAIESGSIGV
ncbi:MobB family relaxase [Flagellimonas eckloniae]|uniref:Mobilization protein n=1 Tax=Flagellimonas eckloniae TaxID=346185 RepID=A0A0Q0WTG4_9FLAO|nr:MobB family relaxase [Allomuricauda eckloniae]KQC28616.1 mobilization protein [Allomuricauda eckloniae]